MPWWNGSKDGRRSAEPGANALKPGGHQSRRVREPVRDRNQLTGCQQKRGKTKLRSADLKGLQDAYKQAFGKSSRSRNREWLFKVIAKKIQDNEEPESAKRPVPLAQLVAKYAKSAKNKTKSAKREKKSKSKVKPVGGRDPRLPKVGAALQREYKGKKLHVTVEADGFTFSGKSYKSLSALAKHITGQIINGFAFFGLVKKEDKS